MRILSDLVIAINSLSVGANAMLLLTINPTLPWLHGIAVGAGLAIVIANMSKNAAASEAP